VAAENQPTSDESCYGATQIKDGSRDGVAVVSHLRGQIGDMRRYMYLNWESLCK